MRLTAGRVVVALVAAAVLASATLRSLLRELALGDRAASIEAFLLFYADVEAALKAGGKEAPFEMEPGEELGLFRSTFNDAFDAVYQLSGIRGLAECKAATTCRVRVLPRDDRAGVPRLVVIQPTSTSTTTSKPSREEDTPAILFIHGGGGVLGTAHDSFAYGLAARLGVAVVSPDYALGPENPFPVSYTHLTLPTICSV